MEALWNLEDKLNLTTHEAIAVLACASLLVIFVVFLAAARRRKGSIASKGSVIHQEPCGTDDQTTLSREVRWSGPKKWDEWSSPGRGQREVATTPTPLLAKRDGDDANNVGWQSHNSTSAVWKKPILMGEKCEFPRFSGLILYDERGVRRHECEGGSVEEQETSAAPVIESLDSSWINSCNALGRFHEVV